MESNARSDDTVRRMTSRQIPEASVARLPVYLRALIDKAESGTNTLSSDELASASGVNSAKIRKDLSYLGSYGTRGVGYDVEYLIAQISRELGLTQDWPTLIVGAGNLGQALANYGGFAERGFRIAAIVDSDDAKQGRSVAGLQVSHMDDVERVVKEHEISIAILAIPGSVAQDVTDRLVTAGVTSILNFAPAVLTVRSGVSLRKVDLSIELQILAYYEQRRQVTEGVRSGATRRQLDNLTDDRL
ncbi:MAG TPA: redox-sensing transcriptional repressor Rex [Euzebya sp.]|nr:redox-sensing transcriptional repressor Rex [Euzebya sp.]